MSQLLLQNLSFLGYEIPAWVVATPAILALVAATFATWWFTGSIRATVAVFLTFGAAVLYVLGKKQGKQQGWAAREEKLEIDNERVVENVTKRKKAIKKLPEPDLDKRAARWLRKSPKAKG